MHDKSQFFKKHPKFGFAVYLDLMKRRLARGEVYEIVFWGLCDHAQEHAKELIEEFEAHQESDTELKYTFLEILAQGQVREAFPVFRNSLNSPDARLRCWAELALKKLDTKEARRVLFEHDRESPSKKN